MKKKLKKANAKLHTNNKPKYIAKADRDKLEQEIKGITEKKQPIEDE